MQSHKKFHAPFLITFFALATMLVMTACGSPAQVTTPTKPTKAPDNQQIYRTAIVGGDISTFDPGEATDLDSISAIDMVFTGLVTLNDQLQVQKQLASSWTESSDGLTWTFKLKPNLKFSDGSSLTSADVAYSIDRALSPDIYNTTGISLTYLGLIQGAADRTTGKLASIIGTGIVAPDDSTVVFHLTQNTAYFLEALSYPTSYVVEKSVFDKWKDKVGDHLSDNGGQGGDGPFKVLSYDHNAGITFVPNPNYEGRQPQLKKVVYPFIKDSETNYLEYQTNQVDQTGIPSVHLQQAATKTKEYRKTKLLAISYYGLNYLVKPLDNIHIRQALELAINKDLIEQTIYHGLRTPSYHIIPNGMPGYNPDLVGPAGVSKTSGDTEKAKALFQQGLTEEGLTLATFPTIKFSYGTGSTDIENEITTVIGMWKDVLGITTIKPDPIQGAAFYTAISNTINNTSLAMWKISWYADYPDPQDWITLQFDKGQADNEINYGQNTSSDAADQQALQPQMETADTKADRNTAYKSIEQKLVDDVAWLTMDQRGGAYLLKSYVQGVIDNAQALTPPDDWGDIYISVH